MFDFLKTKVKIVQIFPIIENSEHKATIYGLSDDGYLYKYDIERNGWKLFVKKIK